MDHMLLSLVAFQMKFYMPSQVLQPSTETFLQIKMLNKNYGKICSMNTTMDLFYVVELKLILLSNQLV